MNPAKNTLGLTADELNGNFSTCGAPRAKAIIDPTTGQAFENNQIPKSRMDPVALAFANRLLTPGFTGNGFFTYQTRIRQDLDQGIMRLDHQFSLNDRLMGRYSSTSSRMRRISIRTTTSVTRTGRGRAKGQPRRDSHLTPSMINDFHFGYMRQFSKRGPPPGVSDWKDLGMTVNNNRTSTVP